MHNAALLLLPLVIAMHPQQVIMAPSSDWKLSLSTSWDVLGPFPIHAREQQYLSPSFPINISEPLDFEKSYPSAYADNGTVTWSKAEATEQGDLRVSFPNVRWDNIRATEGWAALQHHAVLHTTLTVIPPDNANGHIPRLLVELMQGSYIAIMDEECSKTPQWHAGNIYALERSPLRAIDLPTVPRTNGPTSYRVFVAGDYEIRLFGDAIGRPPAQEIKLSMSIESPSFDAALVPSQDVLCDFLQGLPFGNALGVALRSLGGWWTVKSVSAKDFALELPTPVVIAPTQTRIVPLRILQTVAYLEPMIELSLVVSSDQGTTKIVSATIPINHLDQSAPIIQASYFSAGVPTIFTAISPKGSNAGAPILALHGAGVDIISMPFWAEALPRQPDRWIVAPSGRTSWGLDWHGPSAKEAWGCVDALAAILRVQNRTSAIPFSEGTPVLLLGHSNGGQGAWYLASRFPDRVLGVIPASGYIKSQAYVSLAMSRSAHFIDPAVRAILETSLTPDDNDLFLSNLVDTPVLAIHGGDDDNVPVWHSREYVSVLETWNPQANVSFREEPGRSHWYSDIIANEHVQAFMDGVFASGRRQRSSSFTLTVAIPDESGPLHGLKIERLVTPGRLARLAVNLRGDTLYISPSNVQRFSISSEDWRATSIAIDGSVLNLSSALVPVSFERTGRKTWKAADASIALHPQPFGRIQSFLSSSAPFQLVLLDAGHLPFALRIAHDLYTYHRLDSEILVGADTMQTAHNGNVLVIGETSSEVPVADLLQDHRTPFFVDDHRIAIQETVFNQPGQGILFLHPHPRTTAAQMMFLLGTDAAGLERVLRLFPIRTGVTVPDWIITSNDADQIGAAGILGAGVYGNNWSYNNPVSWLY
ncbi:hypothetical protein MKEN_01066400 [Mycena kentingensis (nom. inval.)]|nr:hypothetical protein MKEN_01066400 [Mycena kentingensis (nom. inval.)]